MRSLLSAGGFTSRSGSQKPASLASPRKITRCRWSPPPPLSLQPLSSLYSSVYLLGVQQRRRKLAEQERESSSAEQKRNLSRAEGSHREHARVVKGVIQTDRNLLKTIITA